MLPLLPLLPKNGREWTARSTMPIVVVSTSG
jgi:hypothetical protein